MAVTINRAPWTALIDDSGQNLDGSIWNKAAIKTVLLDPIDAAFASVDLAKGQGVDSNLAAHVIASVVMPALAYSETVRVLISLYQSGGAGSQLTLTIPGVTTIVSLHDLGGGSITAESYGLWEIVIRCVNTANGLWLTKAHGGPLATGTGAARLTLTNSAADWITGGWTLGLSCGIQSAGAKQYWTWSVRKE